MEKAWAIIIDDDQAACMMAIPRLFEQLQILLTIPVNLIHRIAFKMVASPSINIIVKNEKTDNKKSNFFLLTSIFKSQNTPQFLK
ncbi:hypothetical protein [Endozoicomonas atrinae]|uniref:hypothetical protein n=1 Tax=Endozoicomonas atrinae TaxID=1333660 RepID=UPI003AFFC8EF